MNITFIVVLAVIALAIIKGYRKGLISILIDIVSWILIVALVGVLQEPVANLLETTPLGEVVHNEVEAMVAEKTADTVSTSFDNWWEDMTEELPDNISELLKNDVIVDALGSSNVDVSSIVISNSSQYIDALTDAITAYVMQGISAVLVFLLSVVIVNLIKRSVRRVGRLPIIKNVNALAGAVVGVVQGLIWVWLLMFVASFASTSSVGASVVAEISQNGFLTFLYNVNPLAYIINVL